jgi:hypothetical protein
VAVVTKEGSTDPAVSLLAVVVMVPLPFDVSPLVPVKPTAWLPRHLHRPSKIAAVLLNAWHRILHPPYGDICTL